MNFLLPIYDSHLDVHNISVEFADKPTSPYISENVLYYLTQMKREIHEHSEWSTIKLLTNPYEYIHTPYDGKHTISKIQPVSRSFYKLIEMNNMFSIIDKYPVLHSLHVAEGPGGFIEAVRYIRKNNHADTCVGVTLESGDIGVPTWKRIKEKHPEVIYDSLLDKTGNMYHIENIKYIYMKYKNSMHFITADGGFDFSTDYNNQEHSILKLLIIQTFYAIICQKRNGTFIMKMFDITSKASIDILYLLNMFYEKVSICKPVTSRCANSEKYIICSLFRYTSTAHLLPYFMNIIHTLQKHNGKYIVSILKSVPIQHIFKSRVEEINVILGQQQIENIMNTLLYIQSQNKQEQNNHFFSSYYYQNKINKKAHIHKCINWCIRHNIPYKTLSYHNHSCTKHYEYEKTF